MRGTQQIIFFATSDKQCDYILGPEIRDIVAGRGGGVEERIGDVGGWFGWRGERMGGGD